MANMQYINHFIHKYNHSQFFQVSEVFMLVLTLFGNIENSLQGINNEMMFLHTILYSVPYCYL